MITLGDVLFEIAQRMHGYSGADKSAAIEEFVLGHAFDLHLAITTNVQDAEENFLNGQGNGQTFSFPLENYEHGRTLASQMYWLLWGRHQDMNDYDGEQFQPTDKLFFVVYARDSEQAARKHIDSVSAAAK